MRIAVMQPYLFPYLGYFQLIHAVESFVSLDDVSFIKRGWIHRNRLLFNRRIHWFSVPLDHASQNKSIAETRVAVSDYPAWRQKFCRSLEQHYGKAPYFGECYELVRTVLDLPGTEPESIGDMALSSLKACCRRLEIPFSPVAASRSLSRQPGLGRIMALCREYGASTYVNLPGGRDLYQAPVFSANGLGLRFLDPCFTPYPSLEQARPDGLSIIDILMFCGPDQTNSMIANYRLSE